MEIAKYIHIPVFLVSLAIGMFFVYTMDEGDGNGTKKITVFPNPENKHKILYKDNSGTCFQYQETKIKCPNDPSKIKKIPVQ